MLKLPLEWVREFVPVKDRPEELAYRLTMAGFEVTGIDDVAGGPVFSLEITPNRADCLSIVGIAREIAAATGLPMRVPARSTKPRGAAATKARGGLSATIGIEDRDGCRRYIGRVIEGVRVGPSPEWMRRRLDACGIRAINNVVDVTNYVLLELGQPLHAFDYRTLAQATIVVRRAREREQLVTLDGETKSLTPSMLVIADAARPVAIAGVMGGRDTQVTPQTASILLESAWFDPVLVRRTGRALGLSSDSSYRFERGVDAHGVEPASQRAAQLIAELAGGRMTAVVDDGQRPAAVSTVPVDLARASTVLGVPVTAPAAKRLLKPLGFTTSGEGRRLVVRVPSFRRDVRQDVDVIEELARRIGYDELPKAVPRARLEVKEPVAASVRTNERLRDLCVSLGLSEVMTWSLVSEQDLARIGWHASPGALLPLVNPLSRDHGILRPTVLVGLLRVVTKNLAQGATAIRLFELGHAFDGRPAARETVQLGLALSGWWQRTWQGSQPADLFRLKGVVEQLVERLTRGPLEVGASEAGWAEPGQSMRLLVQGRAIGELGEVAHAICEAHDCPERVWYAQLDVDALRAAEPGRGSAHVPSPFPPVKRDMSWLVARQIPVGQLLETIRTAGGPLVHSVELVDRYTGSPVAKDQHSLSFAIQYREPSRTLTAAEVEAVHGRIGQALMERFGAQLR